MVSAAVPTEAVLEKKSSHSASIRNEMQCQRDAEELVVDSAFEGESSRRHSFFRVVGLVGLALLILGWWISSIALQATRHRWVVQTFFAWAFILIIAFRFIPNFATRPVEVVWFSLIQGPFFRIPKYIRFILGWLSFIAIVLGSAFGTKLENVCVLCSALLTHLDT
jgi:CNT family concentrative nucleoside transporter